MKKLKNIHPGKILQEDFLVPLEITAYRLLNSFVGSEKFLRKTILGDEELTTPQIK